MILTAAKAGLKRRQARTVVERIRDWFRCRAELRSLLKLDDALLKDIGLTREEVRAAAYGIAPLRVRRGGSPRLDDRPHAMRILLVAAMGGLSLFSASMADAADRAGYTLPTVADLPAGTIKVSPPVPGMGEHWANPRNLPLGPIYCVTNGKVICAEFMIRQEDLIRGMSFERLRLGMPGKLPAVNHLEITFMPHGHHGFEVPHYDLHMYFVPPEARFPAEARR